MIKTNRSNVTTSRQRALVIGCHGGVGRAVLALLEHTAPGRRLLERLDALLLVDREPPTGAVPVKDALLLPPTTIFSAECLARLVRDHAVTQVIDLSSIDTVDCASACDRMSADFLCTSVEEWPTNGFVTTDHAIARLLPPGRPALGARSHLVGSGANPGIVNALAFAAADAFARRAGVDVSRLGLHSILITEEDTTRETAEPDAASPAGAFPMSWSPAHCLDEIFEPRAIAARKGKIVNLGHAPSDRRYRARCGARVIDGLAIPHEEVSTLSRVWPEVEISFLYRILPAARRALAAHPERRTPSSWPTRRLYPPWSGSITGEDRVGVLLCSRRYGELWMGFRTYVSQGLPLGTNATELQVAAGVIAGWNQLGRRKGIHFVEELDPVEYLRVAAELLGPPTIVHDVSAEPRTLAERAVTSRGLPGWQRSDTEQPALPTS